MQLIPCGLLQVLDHKQTAHIRMVCYEQRLAKTRGCSTPQRTHLATGQQLSRCTGSDSQHSTALSILFRLAVIPSCIEQFAGYFFFQRLGGEHAVTAACSWHQSSRRQDMLLVCSDSAVDAKAYQGLILSIMEGTSRAWPGWGCSRRHSAGLQVAWDSLWGLAGLDR